MRRKREILEKHKYIISFFVRISRILPRGFYNYLLKVTRTHDNYLAMFIRYICLKNCTKSCGDNVAVFSNVYIKNLENIEIGDNVSIHPMCYLEGSGGIVIGNNVSIAHATTIMSEEHLYEDLDINIKDQGVEYKKTVIDDNVWIGAGCRILAGAHIKSGSIVAAGAVVKGLVNHNSIVGGIPAKLLKERTK